MRRRRGVEGFGRKGKGRARDGAGADGGAGGRRAVVVAG